MACRCRSAAAHGFSILEVLVAATLFIIGLVGLTQGLASLRNADARADRLAVMSQIALTWVDRAERADPGTPLFAASCASDATCTVVDGVARRRRPVDETGEPAADGAFIVTWLVAADVPRAGVRRIVLDVVDVDGLSPPFTVETHVR